MSEEMLITYCSPTLAGIKTGNLFSYRFEDKEALNCQIIELNRKLSPKGVSLIPIYVDEGRVLIYLFRPDQLQRDFFCDKSISILSKMGYPDNNCSRCIARLADRIKKSESFPHEIGLFLGYPPEDVEGFMDHKGANALCSGFWKVYHDPGTALDTFEKYRKCNASYMTQYKNGVTLEELTVSL